jgi:hypothetical protein
MVKAGSLLYAIYVCLIVSLLCGALLYMAFLYGQLNQFYSAYTDLYIHNQSLVNYALANIDNQGEIPADDGIAGVYETKQYGLYKILLAKSVLGKDTVQSAHFTGKYDSSHTCLYVPNAGNGLSYSGTVVLNGEKSLPSEMFRQIHINNAVNKLSTTGPVKLSAPRLPDADLQLAEIFVGPAVKADASHMFKKDSVYYNSFFSQTLEVDLASADLADVTIKGNYILRAKDSVFIRKTAKLQDVIIAAPAIAFEEGFKGSLQVFASRTVAIGDNAQFIYPSVICIHNASIDKSCIKAGNNVKVQGDILQYGFPERAFESNSMQFAEKCFITGTVYCAGILSLQGTVYGSVFANRLLHKTAESSYQNCIANVEIDVEKRPDYFISVFSQNNKQQHYGLVKKVF